LRDHEHTGSHLDAPYLSSVVIGSPDRHRRLILHRILAQDGNLSWDGWLEDYGIEDVVLIHKVIRCGSFLVVHVRQANDLEHLRVYKVKDIGEQPPFEFVQTLHEDEEIVAFFGGETVYYGPGHFKVLTKTGMLYEYIEEDHDGPTVVLKKYFICFDPRLWLEVRCLAGGVNDFLVEGVRLVGGGPQTKLVLEHWQRYHEWGNFTTYSLLEGTSANNSIGDTFYSASIPYPCSRGFGEFILTANEHCINAYYGPCIPEYEVVPINGEVKPTWPLRLNKISQYVMNYGQSGSIFFISGGYNQNGIHVFQVNYSEAPVVECPSYWVIARESFFSVACMAHSWARAGRGIACYGMTPDGTLHLRSE